MDGNLLAQLAASGATTLVTAAATELWTDARRGFLRLLGRGDPEREQAIGGRLDALAERIAAAPEPDRPALVHREVQAWQTRLSDLLDHDPGAADALRDLTRRLQLPPAVQQSTVAGRDAFVAGRDQNFGMDWARPA